jgi:serine/threonine protein kinase
MPTSSDRYVILFEEGLSYILSKPLSHGAQGQAYLVTSIEDSKSYIQKKLNAGDTIHEPLFYNCIPTSMVPRLVSRTRFPQSKGDAAIFHHCNGGDLQQFKKIFTDDGGELREVMYWVIIKKICELLAYIKHGWRYEPSAATVKETPNPIIHHDVHAGNIFLHWGDEDMLLPSVRLGDWELSSVLKDQLRRMEEYALIQTL